MFEKLLENQLLSFNEKNKQVASSSLSSDMEAATFTVQHPFGLGPRGPNLPHGAQQAHQGPHQSGSGPSAAPRPEEQHHKPFFYVQPSQSYLPMQGLQWPVPVPMPMSYSPYYGFPGLGKCQISSCASYIWRCLLCA